MTSKELAKLLGLSETSVSFALNGKAGVSTQTRNRVLEAAEKYGMPPRRPAAPSAGTICLLYYRKHGAVLNDSSFFTELTEGVEQKCAEEGWRVSLVNVYSPEDLEIQIRELSNMKTAGLMILGTEMKQDDFNILPFAEIPCLLLDNHFISARIDSVQINNTDGAFTAANYLIKKLKVQPGYLHSSYPINNFDQRTEGFHKALRHNGMSVSNIVVHELTPSIDGAFADMTAILESGEKPVRSYFADNDQIAIGAMRALREKGFRIPEDVALIGFDDIPMCSYTEPPLSTVHVPKHHMGIVAAERLLSAIRTGDRYSVNIEISTNLVLRRTI
ncbi:LacI family DNA-binding transcriptional regulator [Lachnoclostridium sp. Marseille-P6806]|uniref:LacI family DNA-binding transcriptional regulator n=1 Tax=Lachnoclostridium sp. Marseille-P6806 TaxID=2364793 RepID=UPI001F5FC874|nr:LacI family DNA-binding transcriptional regulator [Lachnoclostridium sp. Marseille-P6806]